MDVASLLGLFLGIGVLVVALFLGQVPLENIFHPEALLVVLGGTCTSVLVGFSSKALRYAIQGFYRSFFPGNQFSNAEVIDYLIGIAGFVRAEGALAMQPLLEEVEIPLLRKGIALIMDNRSESFIRESLAMEIEVCYREEMDQARVFESAGGFSPTMGIVGAVIGLIQVSGSFKNPTTLGHGVAHAFSATLYGVVLSNFFLLPIAGKLRQRTRDAWFQKTILLEGILGIRRGEHPMVLEEKLLSFLNDGTSSTKDLLVQKTQRDQYISIPASSAAPKRQPKKQMIEWDLTV